MSVDAERVQLLFLQLVALVAEERHDALIRECAGDMPLQLRVEALLKAHDNPDSLLNNADSAVEATVLTGSEKNDAGRDLAETHPGDVVPGEAAADAQTPQMPDSGQVIAGRYTLEQKIGEGGMGEVWVANQSQPVKRRVALKLIKAGMDSSAVLKRFELERQALAMMEHPNIARVLDGGLTPSGRPFFVMELVNGLPLTRFCDEIKLTPKARLELFLPVCLAVQHAHQKGIVHRDLKPANILVTVIDGQPVPKVIDFGVAKALSGKLTDDSISTQFGAVLGTLEYMSPEQAGFSGTDVDTRADIYSLGVILYEVLAGLRPIDAARLKNAALAEMIRMIREDDPSRPSMRLSTAESLPSLAAVRQTDPKKLTALLKGELDWVVMKCLEKQRDRRYETASALARDIERHLNDEPVEARPPSAGYRFGKFARRNRAAIVTICLVTLSLVVGLGVSLWQAIRATRAEQEVTTRFENEQTARREAQTAKEGERTQRLLADEAKRLAERREYAANLLLVQQSWQQNNIGGFRSLLESIKPADEEDDLRGFEWYYWSNKAGRGCIDLPIQDDPVSSVAYSPDGTHFITGAGDGGGVGRVRVWNTQTRQMIRELPQHMYRVHSVAMSPDGKYVASACGEHEKGGSVHVWELATGKEVFRHDFRNCVSCVAFSPDPDGTRLVAGSIVLSGKWGELKVWDWRAKEELFSEEHENKGFRGALFTPDGKSVVVGSRENGVPSSQIEIWNLESNSVEILPAHADFVFGIAIRPENAEADQDYRLAAAVGSWSGHPGVVKQWDSKGQEIPLQLVGHSSRVVDVCFSSDGKKIGTACFDNTARIWDAESGDELAVLRGHMDYVSTVRFSPNGQQLLTAGSDRNVKIWDANGQQAPATDYQKRGVNWVTYNSDGTLIASAGGDGTARIWDAATGVEIKRLTEPKNTDNEYWSVNRLAFSPDDKLLATASGEGTSYGFERPPIPGDIRVWDLTTQQIVHHFEGHSSKGCDVTFSPDGKLLASASGGWGETGEIKVWDLETGKELDLGLDGEVGTLWPVAFSPDGRFLAWARLDYPDDVDSKIAGDKAILEGRAKSLVVLWDLQKRKRVWQLYGHKGGVIDLVFHPKEMQLATASADFTVTTWDLETGTAIQTLRGHSRRVHGVDYSPDGTQLISAGADGTVKLWDLYTGREMLTLEEHTNNVWSAAFSPDGEHIASGSRDGTVRIWDGTGARKHRSSRKLSATMAVEGTR